MNLYFRNKIITESSEDELIRLLDAAVEIIGTEKALEVEKKLDKDLNSIVDNANNMSELYIYLIIMILKSSSSLESLRYTKEAYGNGPFVG